MTNEQIFAELKEDAEQWSNTLVTNFKSAIEESRENIKMSIWYFSLTLGMGAFLLNYIDKDNLGWYFSIPMLILITATMISSLGLGILIRIKLSRQLKHYLELVDAYDYQRSLIKICRLIDGQLSKDLMADFAKNKTSFINNITEFKYNKPEFLDNNIEINNEGLKFLNSYLETPLTLFLAQFIFSIILIAFQMFY